MSRQKLIRTTCCLFFYAHASLSLAMPILPPRAKVMLERAPLKLELNKEFPHDIDILSEGQKVDVTIDRENANIFAWNVFFAANWPAEAIDSGKRGTPSSKPFGTPGPVVWNTFKEKREMFRVVTINSEGGRPSFSFDTSDPGSFDTLPKYPSLTADIGPCDGTDPIDPAKVYNYLDESQEIGLATIWVNDGFPSEDNLVRTQVKMNRDYYDYVRKNEFYATETLNDFIERTVTYDHTAPYGGIELPYGDEKKVGTILVKTSWLKNSQLPQSLQDKYFTVDAIYYKDFVTPAGAAGVCYAKDKFSLAAIHLIHKTKNFQTFFYSSFENNFNRDVNFVYANALGGASTLPNAFGHMYDSPPNPVEGIVNPPYLVQQLNDTDPITKKINTQAQKLMRDANPEAIWQNYHLVGVQYAPVDTPFNLANREQDYYLANPVVETNQRFQFFTGSFADSEIANVQAKPYAYTNRVRMGGCMGCHGAGAQGAALQPSQIVEGTGGGTDFSFIMLGARFEPKTFGGVETLYEPAVRQITSGPAFFPWLPNYVFKPVALRPPLVNQ